MCTLSNRFITAIHITVQMFYILEIVITIISKLLTHRTALDISLSLHIKLLHRKSTEKQSDEITLRISNRYVCKMSKPASQTVKLKIKTVMEY